MWKGTIVLKGFKDFLLRGNVVDLAVAVVIGTAFAALITTFTDSVINPLVAVVGGADSIGLGLQLGDEGNRDTFLDVGAVVTGIINFVIVAAVVYFAVVIPVTRLMAMRKRGEEPEVEAPSEDVLLLQEIRDLLRSQRGV
jgi:large conductance mechanosensitive channel